LEVREGRREGERGMFICIKEKRKVEGKRRGFSRVCMCKRVKGSKDEYNTNGRKQENGEEHSPLFRIYNKALSKQKKRPPLCV